MANRTRSKWKSDASGQFTRQIGWKLSDQGKLVQHKFRLGTDKKEAKLRDARLVELWQQIERSASPGKQRVWGDVTLKIGKAIASGKREVVLESGADYRDARHFHTLQRVFSMVNLVPSDREQYQQQTDANLSEVKTLLEEGEAAIADYRRLAELSGDIPPNELVLLDTDETLHQAIDAYIKHVRFTKQAPGSMNTETRLTPYGRTMIMQAERLKQHHLSMALSSIDLKSIECMVQYWRDRPISKKSEKPMTKKTVENHLAELFRLFKWLHRSPDWKWRKPDDFSEIDRRVPETPEEIQKRHTPLNVQTFDRDELCLLNEYATLRERILLLLGLNCGFGAAEMGSLLLNQIFIEEEHPHAKILGFDSKPTDSYIKRVRLKNKVYGEHKLWPQTIEMLKWATARRNVDESNFLFVRPDGRPLYDSVSERSNRNQAFANIWNGLVARVRADYPNFQKLSFGKLRKTAGNLIRRFSSGEIEAVFLCHGQPVASDKLADLYSNRPFAKVFETTAEVGEYLEPMFKAASNSPTEQPQQQYTGKRVVKRIHELHERGLSVRQIASEVGKSRMTVYRQLQRS